MEERPTRKLDDVYMLKSTRRTVFPTDIDIGVCIPYCTSMHPHGVALLSSLTKTKAHLVPLQPHSPYLAYSIGVRPDGRVGSGVLGRNRSGFVGLSRDGISASRDRFRGQGGKRGGIKPKGMGASAGHHMHDAMHFQPSKPIRVGQDNVQGTKDPVYQAGAWRQKGHATAAHGPPHYRPHRARITAPTSILNQRNHCHGLRPGTAGEQFSAASHE